MSKNFKQFDLSYSQNRELSWLKFNQRVLEEAQDPQVPLLERLKFISIFSSNLDEFFMVRTGTLLDLSKIAPEGKDNKSGMTPKEQLAAIRKAVIPLLARRDQIYNKLRDDLARCGICELEYTALSYQEKEYAKQYFQKTLKPLLTTHTMVPDHSHLHGNGLYIGVLLSRNHQEQPILIALPDTGSPILLFPGNSCRFIRIEEIIFAHMQELFPQDKVLEKAVISLIRNADLSYLEETTVAKDYADKLSDLLKLRDRRSPVKLEFQGNAPKLEKKLAKLLEIPQSRIYRCSCPFHLSYAESFQKETLLNPPFTPPYPDFLTPGISMRKQIARKDILLLYPFQSMQPFLDLLEESTVDPCVISIQITLYRLAKQSKIIRSLIQAAQQGKKVTVLIELRARFDEQNNIEWAKQLQQAGCQVLYGPEHLKCHAKLCLITRREKEETSYITQIGTGNYNETTAKLYTDFCLMTADPSIGADAADFFENMKSGTIAFQYRKLLVAPISMKPALIQLIDNEIKKGGQGRIIIKANSITDRELIDKLSQASQAGVKIDLIIRGICCILPGIPGKTDQITVTSIVGRFLEHSRVYSFGSGASQKIYLSSADLMTRNQNRRVEIACPVQSIELKKWLSHYLNTLLSDNTKARLLTSSGVYRKKAQHDYVLNAQEYFIKHPPSFSKPVQCKQVLLQWLFRFFNLKFALIKQKKMKIPRSNKQI